MKKIAQHKHPGNEQVVAGLEKALERARHGAVRAAALIVCEHLSAEAFYFGDENARTHLNFGLDMLKHAILNDTIRVHSAQPPPANMVAYDLKMDPVSFDFIPWLATQEMVRRREQAASPLRVAFTANPLALPKQAVAGEEFVTNVIRPALALFDAVEVPAGVPARHPDFTGLRDVARFHAQGEEVPRLTVPEPAVTAVRDYLQGRQPVTFTLREAENYPQRNSNLEEWHRLAMWLCKQGEDVIIVRDTARAHEGFPGFQICPDASCDLHARAALYTLAKCNMFVQNGPFSLAPYTQTPWLMFANVSDDDPEEYNRPYNWQMVTPTNDEGQLPWASQRQRIVYGPDTFEVMQPAYEALYL